MNYYDFLRDWENSYPEVDSRRSLHTWPMRKWPCSSSTVAVACVLGFAGDAPRAVFPMMPAIFLLLSSCNWKSAHCFFEPLVFSAFSTVEILRWSIFWSPRARTGVSARGLGVGADAGSSLSGVGPPGVHN